MKSEREIRAHRDALKVLKDSPCDCPQRGRVCTQDCVEGQNLMVATENMLSWILGERPGLQEVVDTINRNASAYLAERN